MIPQATTLDRRVLLVLAVLLAVITLPLAFHQVATSGDIGLRMSQVEDIAQGNTADLLVNTPYYSFAIYAIYALYPALGVPTVTALLTTAFYVAGGILVYVVLMRALTARRPWTPWVVALLTVLLTGIQPIILAPLLPTGDMLFDWIAISTHHNPTMMAMRVFVLPLALIAAAVFNRRRVYSWGQILGVVALIIVSTLIKPNWLIAFLPMFALCATGEALQGRRLDWRMILIGFGLASALVLVTIFAIGFIAADNSSIVFRFPAYLLTPTVMAKLLLSLAFPLYVTVAWSGQARRDLALVLAWGVLAVALLQGLAFDEIGLRAGYGNFLWGQGIAAWVVFVLTTRVYLTETHSGWSQGIAHSTRWRVATVLLMLHAVSTGLWWLLHCGVAISVFG